MKLRTIFASSLLAASFLVAPLSAPAQQKIEPRSDTQAPTHGAYDRQEILVATVHQAWLLSGKNEANFFEMVAELAQISATNRGITLPDDAATGRRMGEYIKRSAKADTDQLLFAVVDKAVRMTSTKPVHSASSSR